MRAPTTTREEVDTLPDAEVTDTDLVERARSGEPAAFAPLVRRHAPIARRMAVLWGAGADADDVVQEAFVKAYAALPRFRTDGNFRAWLLSIVRNETRNVLRGRGRRAARDALAAGPVEGFVDDAETATTAALRRQGLAAGVRGLPPRFREVVACRYLLELSEAETAAALGIPHGTVKSRLRRGLDLLRAGLLEGGHDDRE